MDNCQDCHGDGAEFRAYAAFNRWTNIAEETDTAIMEVPLMMTPSLEALTLEEIDAIADFLGPL
jgi:mono/diheme cytochrome c family protein